MLKRERNTSSLQTSLVAHDIREYRLCSIPPLEGVMGQTQALDACLYASILRIPQMMLRFIVPSHVINKRARARSHTHIHVYNVTRLTVIHFLMASWTSCHSDRCDEYSSLFSHLSALSQIFTTSFVILRR
jgi:hypothetical protein